MTETPAWRRATAGARTECQWKFGVDWTPRGGWLIALRGGGRTGYFSDDANTPSRRVHGHWTLDGRIEKKIGHATLFAYGRNLLDKFGYNFFLTQVADLADPREFGAGCRRTILDEEEGVRTSA